MNYLIFLLINFSLYGGDFSLQIIRRSILTTNKRMNLVCKWKK